MITETLDRVLAADRKAASAKEVLLEALENFQEAARVASERRGRYDAQQAKDWNDAPRSWEAKP